MQRKVSSYRLPDSTLLKIKELAKVTGMSDANVLMIAIDRMYQQETRTMTSNFGTVTHEGTTYTLTKEPDFSNRQFPGSWFDAQEGESYTAEFSAKAHDSANSEYWVYWQFETVKGEEPPLDGYPWHDRYISHVTPQ